MLYIKETGTEVTLGGTVVTKAMLEDGWKPYEGNIPALDPTTQNLQLLDGVLVAVTRLSTEELIRIFKEAIQAKIDTAAQAKGYDNIVSACSYAGYENPFRAEGEAFGVWRANVWAYGYKQLALIQTGARAIPTVEEFLAELPTMEA